MRVFRPYRLYLQIFILCTIIIAATWLAHQEIVLSWAGIVYGLGAVLVLSLAVMNPRLSLDEKNTLAYSTIFSQQSVDLTIMTECSYKFRWKPKGGWEHYFHIFDSAGNYANIPANQWGHRTVLYAALRQAISANSISVDAKTAKKLSLRTTQS